MSHRFRTANPKSPAAIARAKKHHGREHREAKKTWQHRIDNGQPVHCWRSNCHARLYGRAWHLGHDDIQTDLIRGPECISCNLRAAARKGNAIQRARRQPRRRAQSRAW